MAISNYSELQAAITSWMDRSDVAGQAADLVTLAEAGLNRELEAVEADATLTGTIGSRSIDVSAYQVIEGVNLWIKREGDEFRLAQKPEGTFAQSDDNGEPAVWALDNGTIDFDCPLNHAFAFRLRYRGRFALSDAAPTNDLLTHHPDVYLGACVVWGGLYIQSDTTAARWERALNRFIAQTRAHLAQGKRGTLTVDPTLAAIGRPRRGTHDATVNG